MVDGYSQPDQPDLMGWTYRARAAVNLALLQDIGLYRRNPPTYRSSGWPARALLGLSVLSLLLLAFALPARATLVPPAAPLQYLNQNSATSFYHSGIVTTNGVVWDTNFANFVNTGIGTNYNEIAFAFMQCFGGGMIDELGALNLVPASYTAASQWNQPSVSGARDPAGGGLYQSYYNIPFAPAAGGAAVNTMLQAATTGYNRDLVGPVINKPMPFGETPQYTSSGPIGDSITLDRNNPNNPTKNTNYLAILFGGAVANNNNLNSLVRMYNALIARGYAANQIYVLYPGGMTPGNIVPVNANATAANLKTAWTTVASGKTSPTTQIYYWSGPAHGQLTFDWVGFLKSLGQSILKGITYSFNLVGSFVSQLQSIYSFYLGAPQASLELPFVEVATQSPASGLTAALNGGIP